MAKNVKEVEGSKSTPMTQETVDAVMASDPKEGRAAIATRLGVPPAQVWAIRAAVGQLKVSPEAVAYCKARCKRAGVSIPTKRAPRKLATKKAAKT